MAGYLTARVERGMISQVVTATGAVNPVALVQVGTYVSGPIQEIYVDFNSPVRKGQLIAKIDPRPVAVKVRQAEAKLADARTRRKKAQADLGYTELTLKRTQELFRRGLISQDALDMAQSGYEQAQAQLELAGAQVKEAEAALEEARVSLECTRIVSPVDGVVISRNADGGQTVAASFRTPVLFLVARTLLHDPILLLARLNRERGLTVILVTHEADVASYARRRMILQDGRLIADPSGDPGRRS